MGQQEYDAFREQMKQWMLDHSDINDEFEEMMNSQSDVGVQQIMAQAMMLVPEYGKLISKKKNISKKMAIKVWKSKPSMTTDFFRGFRANLNNYPD